jgi:hypothetical protein
MAKKLNGEEVSNRADRFQMHHLLSLNELSRRTTLRAKYNPEKESGYPNNSRDGNNFSPSKFNIDSLSDLTAKQS